LVSWAIFFEKLYWSYENLSSETILGAAKEYSADEALFISMFFSKFHFFGNIVISQKNIPMPSALNTKSKEDSSANLFFLGRFINRSFFRM